MKTTSLLVLVIAASAPTFAVPLDNASIEGRQGSTNGQPGNNSFSNGTPLAIPANSTSSSRSGRAPLNTASSISHSTATKQSAASPLDSNKPIDLSYHSKASVMPGTASHKPYSRNSISAYATNGTFPSGRLLSSSIRKASTNPTHFPSGSQGSHNASSMRRPSFHATGLSPTKAFEPTPKSSAGTATTRKPISSASAIISSKQASSSKAPSTATTKVPATRTTTTTAQRTSSRTST